MFWDVDVLGGDVLSGWWAFGRQLCAAAYRFRLDENTIQDT